MVLKLCLHGREEPCEVKGKKGGCFWHVGWSTTCEERRKGQFGWITDYSKESYVHEPRWRLWAALKAPWRSYALDVHLRTRTLAAAGLEEPRARRGRQGRRFL